MTLLFTIIMFAGVAMAVTSLIMSMFMETRHRLAYPALILFLAGFGTFLGGGFMLDAELTRQEQEAGGPAEGPSYSFEYSTDTCDVSYKIITYKGEQDTVYVVTPRKENTHER